MTKKYNKFQEFIIVCLLGVGFTLPYSLGVYDFFDNKACFWIASAVFYVMAICTAYSFKEEEDK